MMLKPPAAFSNSLVSVEIWRTKILRNLLGNSQVTTKFLLSYLYFHGFASTFHQSCSFHSFPKNGVVRDFGAHHTCNYTSRMDSHAHFQSVPWFMWHFKSHQLSVASKIRKWNFEISNIFSPLLKVQVPSWKLPKHDGRSSQAHLKLPCTHPQWSQLCTHPNCQS